MGIQRPGTDMPDTIHTPTDTDTDTDIDILMPTVATVPTDILMPMEDIPMDIITANKFSDEYRIEDPSWLPSPPSNRCGSPSKNMTNAAHPLSTENASKLYLYFCYLFYRLVLLYTCCLLQYVNSHIPKRGKL